MGEPATHLLVVDDDQGIRELLQEFLSQHQYQVSTAADGQTMRQQLQQQQIDLVIMDLMLPQEDGLQLCKVVQQHNPALPVIMVTALGSDMDRIIGLEVGADDYIAKPFNPRELLARIRAVLRRSQMHHYQAVVSQESGYCFADWTLWLEKRSLQHPEWGDTQLSNSEFELLLILLRHPQQVLSRDRLLDMTRGIEANPLDRSIDIQISRIRRKLHDEPPAPRLIQTIRNGGYCLNTTVQRISR